MIISLILLAAILFFTHTIKSTLDAESRAKEIRTRYIEAQRALITYEGNSVGRIIDYEIDKSLQDAKAKVKERVYEACSIAQHIYEQNVGSKSDREIQKMVIDALRPIRFSQGSGYFFMTDFNGISKLFPIDPSLEGTSIIDSRDIRGKYLVRKAIEIAKNQGEGFNHYYWTKPDKGKREFEKISYIKRFEPFGWYIGTGIYLDTIEAMTKDAISHYVDTNRFGANEQGYAFVIELLNINGGKNFGRMFANPNLPDAIGKLISDDIKDARGKMFRKEYLKGLRENGACYVDYWYSKIDNPEPSPKISYFKLAGNGRFIVAAGVYLDDVEAEINRMHADMKIQLRRDLFIIILIFLPAIITAIALFNVMSRKLRSDFDLFVDFFKRAAVTSKFIDQDKVRFNELDQLAGFANWMLTRKTEVEEALRKKHAHLEHWVSQQKRTAGELRKSEEKYRVLVENASDAIFINQDGMLKFCNPFTEKLTGYPKEELLVIPLSEIVHPEDRDYVGALHKPGLSNRQPTISDQPFRLVRKDGRNVWVQASVVLVEWEDQPATLNFLRDVTKQKELEKKLVQGQKLEAIGTLAGGIAHDFNNILSGLIGYSQLALHDVEEMPATKRKLLQILKAGERAADLVRQILSFSRSQKIERKPISPLIITKEVLKLIRATIPVNIEIKQSLKSEGFVLAGATSIHQIVMNLCTNAAHAMRETGGVLSVSLENVKLGKEDLAHQPGVKPGDFLKISVEDNGIGMTKEVQEKAFDPFYTTKGPGEGTGMGLASVHGITADLGGFVSFYSESGQGTSMHVFLPLIAEVAEIENGLEKKPVRGGTERILFVDDEPTQRDLAEDALSRYGYRVTAFSDGVAAMTHFQTNPMAYDILITDMTMPKMTGDKLTRKIRQKRPDIPVILCTGYSEIMDEKKAEALGIDAFLYKPVIIGKMLETIREVLERKM
ncbi:cache domain-containing protein [uncultured Desulfosarcina sp.]|uniref:cache domain-containing protein n=1 Tax=uncultured Desulfosarcina sp. TaxID=218289 RepID=UPI0029C80F63|nr:cache domain-containing protein [uncultured Desulfosarcina sp.]